MPLGNQLGLTVKARLTSAAVTPSPATSTGGVAAMSGYSYRLVTNEGHELVVYQWDPGGVGSIVPPHFHIGRALAHPSLPSAFRREVSRLSKAHMPTGPITLAMLVRTAIEDLGAVPHRADWGPILSDAEITLQGALPIEVPHVR